MLSALCLGAPAPLHAVPPQVIAEVVASGLEFPVNVTHAGDERLFITLKGGEVRILENGLLLPEPFLDLTDLVSTQPADGLFSIAFHPEFAVNGFFFVQYVAAPSGDTVIARYRVSADPDIADPDSEAVLLRFGKPIPSHHGGQLHFGPDGYLYAATGDSGGADDPFCRAQDDGSLLGKVLRLDVDQNVDRPPFYGIPDDNPFLGPGDPLDEIWAKGLRNPWRFSFDRLTGDLWIADVGQAVYEEIDFQPAGSAGGQNYGWKMEEGILCRNQTDGCTFELPPCGSPLYTPPVLTYSSLEGPECAITGGYVYRGGAIPGLVGSYVYGDFCSGKIWRALRDGQVWILDELGAQLPRNGMDLRLPGLVSFGEDSAGELYAVAGDKVYRLLPRGQQSGPCFEDEFTLCFQGGRFRVQADWVTRMNTFGLGHAVPLSDDSGYFWFFNEDNVEVLTKVLRACVDPFQHYWVFAAGLTDVQVNLVVYDTFAAEPKTYTNPQRTPFQPIQDTRAFATCP